MENTACEQPKNPLETEAIGRLIWKYSLPAIASSLVGSLYNIIDQIFVGNSIGKLGNAATNVAFPIVVAVAGRRWSTPWSIPASSPSARPLPCSAPAQAS